MAADYKPCLLIPVYNHEGPLPGVIARLKPHRLPCLLVDDGSAPGCAEVMRDLAAREPWLRYIRYEENRGKGHALKIGLEAAEALGYSHAVQIDADGQHDVEDLDKFLKASEAQPDAVIAGCPIFDDTVPKTRYYGRYLTHVWVWINTLSFTIRDALCGYRVYPVAPCVNLIRTSRLGNRMEFDVEILIRLYWLGVPIVSLPTRVKYPEDGISHFRLWRDNVLLSRMQARMFAGMLRRLPALLRRHRQGSGTAGGHWASTEETGILWGMRTLLLIHRLCGRWAFRLALYPVVAYYFLTNRKARAASRQYLDRLGRYYPELGIGGGWRDSYRHFLSFAETLLDKLVVWLDRLDPKQVDFHNRPLILDLLERGRGAILLTGHIGNLETCRALAELRDPLHLNILVHTKHAEKFNRLLGSVDRRNKIELIQVTDLNPAIAMRLHEKVDRGEFLVLVGDRIPVTSRGRTVRAPFLGYEAEFPIGPYVLASLLRCPVLSLFSYPLAGRFQIYVEPFADGIALPRGEPARRRELEGWARRYAERLEFHCRRVPLQWFNFFGFWDSPEAAGGHG